MYRFMQKKTGVRGFDFGEGCSVKSAPFYYARPQSVSDALSLLSAEGSGAKILAVGQSLGECS